MKFLLPLLKRTAQSAPPDSVRVVWLSSMLSAGVVKGGITFDPRSDAPQVLKNSMENYMQSKVGNLFIASEMSKHYGSDGILSLVGALLFSHLVLNNLYGKLILL
jgi:retinol dehydrogenase 12